MKTGGSEPNAQTLTEIERAYAEYGCSLLRFATRLCGNRDDAEDIVVETFTQAYRKWDGYHGTASRLSWLYGIAVNRHRMNRRKNRNRPVALTDDVPALPSNALDRIAIESAISRLPLHQRESFLLVKSEGMTSREAAEILRRPIGTVCYEVFQAVRSIRVQLGEEEEVDSPVPSKTCEAEP